MNLVCVEDMSIITQLHNDIYVIKHRHSSRIIMWDSMVESSMGLRERLEYPHDSIYEISVATAAFWIQAVFLRIVE